MLFVVGLFLVLIVLVYFYLWKRLVQDPLTGRLQRRIGAVVATALALLVPVTLVGARTGWAKWVAWPGFLWIAVMFYLLITLAVLEIPRLAILLLWRRSARRPQGGVPTRTAGSSTSPGEEIPTSGYGLIADRKSPGKETPAREALSAGDGTPAGKSTSARRSTSADDGARTSEETPAREAMSAGDGTPAGESTSARGSTSAGDGMLSSTETPCRETTPASAKAPTRRGTPTSGENPAEAKVSAGGLTSAVGVNSADKGDGQGVDRRLVLARGMAIFAGLTAAGITGYGVKTALGPPQLNRVQFPLAKLPRPMDQTRLVLVSDIHLGPLTGTRHVGRIVELINSVNADFVCIVGDLVDGTVAELGRFATPLKDIESRRGAYFVTGNHEYYSGFQPWIDEVARLGVRPLRNERVALDGLDLAGVNDLGGADYGDGPDFARALGDRDRKRPVVLMAHQPIVAHQAAPFGVDLQVSGHTHGGQMAPFNLLVKLQQPVVSGLGDVDGVPVFVTNGAGFWGPPVRVGAPPQVTVIELRAP